MLHRNIPTTVTSPFSAIQVCVKDTKDVYTNRVLTHVNVYGTSILISDSLAGNAFTTFRLIL